MFTAMHEVSKLRRSKSFTIDPQNTNPHVISVNENDGNTAYCFSTPIYNSETKRLVSRKFIREKDGYYFIGSNSKISAKQNQLIFDNNSGYAILQLPFTIDYELDGAVYANEIMKIVPTFNGVMIHLKASEVKTIISLDKHFELMTYGTKCISFNEAKFKPFITVSALFGINELKRGCPISVLSKDVSNNTFEFMFNSFGGSEIAFEINLYESKLFQDTTVNSLFPNENNAFGSIAFIGNSEWMGEQWLYSRPDYGKLIEFNNVRITKVLWHIPHFVQTEQSLRMSISVPNTRFCSFGSTWNTKVAHTASNALARPNGKYITIDLTSIMTYPEVKHLCRTEGMVLRKYCLRNDYNILATADSYYAPQILEIRYEK